jgi:cytochrome oxidase Cu insertion factor (SCO1/SenC/PrrC family)
MLTRHNSGANRWGGKPCLIFAAAIFLMIPAGCGGQSETDSPTADKAPGAHGTPPANIAASPELITVPGFRLNSQNDEVFRTKSLDGKVWVASFIYTRCTEGCPAQTAMMVELQKKLAGHPAGDDIHLVSITVDPAHDTPEVLRAYAEKSGSDLSSWTFLTGNRETIQSISHKGFNQPAGDPAKDATGPLGRNSNLILLDRASRIRGQFDALDQGSLAKLLEQIDAVLPDPPGAIGAIKDPPFAGGQGNQVYNPPDLKNSSWMEARAAAQAKTVDSFQVNHAFKFENRVAESGISFVNKVVEDGGKHYKGVHYDHGNGVMVADVDGDGLLDIYFVNQVGSNGLFRNLGGGRFEDITAASGVAVDDRIGVTASFADIDNDGDADLYVTSVRRGNLLFENDGSGKFADITAASGLGHQGHSSAAVFFDYDRDGRLDVFLTNVGEYTTDAIGPDDYYIGHPDAFGGHQKPERAEQSILFHNEGGNKFKDVSQATGLQDKSWSGAASPFDLNEDGWPDLYILSMQGHDQYYENVEGKRFERKSREIFPRTSWGTMGISVFDFDNDGRQDIYTTDMHTDMVDDITSSRRFWYAEKMKMSQMYPDRYLMTDGNHIRGNSLFHNLGNGEFREISDSVGAENYWPWGLSSGDLNADGWVDVFITSSMNYPYRYGVNSLLLNNKGRNFLDSEFILGVEPRRDGRMSKLWFSLDCDGADGKHDGCRGLKGRVDVHGALGSRSSVLFDLDDDGDLDIVTNEFNSEPMVLISNLAANKPDLKYIKIALRGSKSNRDGLGARVRVTSGKSHWTKIHDGQSGYLSQSLMPLYFGLGDAGTVDQVEVTWPSGNTQMIDGPLEANKLLTISEE